MHFSANTFINVHKQYACAFDWEIGKRKETYIRTYNDSDQRSSNIDETKYSWLQLNLERVVNNIRHLAANVYPEHYAKFEKQIAIVQEIKMSYKVGTPPDVLIEKISDFSETFYKLTPPRDSKYYKSLKSQITALVLYCEIN